MPSEPCPDPHCVAWRGHIGPHRPFAGNPWRDTAPPCPRGHGGEDVYLWDPPDRWICTVCMRTFRVEVAA